jgi:hypothetical protein
MMGNMGFVPLEEIRNVFIEALAKLEVDYVKTNGIPADFKTIIEDIDDIRRKLNSRAQYNLQHYLKSHPEVKKEQRDAKQENEAKKDTRDWKERVKSAREEAIRDCYREPNG